MIAALGPLACAKKDDSVPTGPPSEVMLSNLLESPDDYLEGVIVTEGAFSEADIDGLSLLSESNKGLKSADSALTMAFIGMNSHASLDCVDGLARATGFVDTTDGLTLFVYRLDTRSDSSDAWVNCFESALQWQ